MLTICSAVYNDLLKLQMTILILTNTDIFYLLLKKQKARFDFWKV